MYWAITAVILIDYLCLSKRCCRKSSLAHSRGWEPLLESISSGLGRPFRLARMNWVAFIPNRSSADAQIPTKYPFIGVRSRKSTWLSRFVRMKPKQLNFTTTWTNTGSETTRWTSHRLWHSMSTILKFLSFLATKGILPCLKPQKAYELLYRTHDLGTSSGYWQFLQAFAHEIYGTHLVV